LNYRHAFHAGNFADVLKHALLAQLVKAFQKKDRGFLFVDTHAGRGKYDLSLAAEGDTQARQPEWPGGIGRLWDRSDIPPSLMDYMSLVRRFDRSQGNLTLAPRFYPGSPKIVSLMGRPQDRLDLWEKHPAECAALRKAFDGERRVSFHEADGYGAMKASLPPAERRSLVLIDPPYEDADEWSSVSHALNEGIARFPAGTFAIWYPLTERAGAAGFADSLRTVAAPSLAAELRVDGNGTGLEGCGVAVINPPWRFDEEARAIVRYLDGLLSDDGPENAVRWIVPE
jgi:23S rRNA (adenine2030-N6)-methyltransferase